MVAPRPPSVSLRPPPDVPHDPDISPQLTQYLRTFALWCRGMFQSKLDSQVAQPSILMMEDGVIGVPRVYKLTVKVTAGTPAIVLTQVPLGEGLP